MEDVLALSVIFGGTALIVWVASLGKKGKKREEHESLPSVPISAPATSPEVLPVLAQAWALPQPQRTHALCLLSALKDLPSGLDMHTDIRLRQIRDEYLPETLSTYLSLSPALRTQHEAELSEALTRLEENANELVTVANPVLKWQVQRRFLESRFEEGEKGLTLSPEPVKV